MNAEDLLPTLAEERHGLWKTAELSYANPAVNQWRLPSGYTEISGSLSIRNDSNNPDPREGTGDTSLKIGAVTYTKYKSSTIWGDASYTNSRTRSVVWNETGDPHLLYPYLMADSIGGDLNREQYRFHGGYGAHSDRWAWGVEMSYRATLEYRSTDPRPRNVTGVLDINAGVMRHIAGHYFAGLQIGWQKYKQDNEISFKGEMGVDKIYHLTGLGNHYHRFAGTGLMTYYTGSRYLVGLNLYPADNRGVFATLLLSRFSFTNILSDLNKLPLAAVCHNQLHAQAGWLDPSRRFIRAASAEILLYRRHGSENQFGDPSSAEYPVIGCNDMFADNAILISATIRQGMRFGPVSRFHIELQPGWSHRTIAYLEPYSYKELSHITLRGTLSGTLLVASRWMLDTDFSITGVHPYGCRLSLPATDSELRPLSEIERASYNLESHRSLLLAAGVGATRSIGKRYAANISAEWTRESRYGGMKRNQYNVKINFLF